jgi:glycine cleavage system aminomethyltransferase T/glycine/D-amino acid oxidase-like deaminating enzyme
MRSEAQAVVIGGGVGGASIAYHLARLGWKDIVLVEQYDLTSGSTWHSAGLVGQLRSSVSLTRMMMYSVGLYADLRRETGKDPGWHEVGGLRLASSPARMDELRRQAGWAETFGLPLELVSAAEAQERFPLMSPDGVLGAAWLPHDGYLDPSQLTFALADGARRFGAEIVTRTRVTGITQRNGRVHEVVTDKGTIRTDVVVNAAGMAAPDVARLVGVTVPIITMAHQYLVTEPFAPALEPLPTLRDPDNLVYFRTEVGGLVMGGYERDPAPFGLDGIPAGFEAQLLTEDWDRFEELMAGAVTRVPTIEHAEVKRFFNGPEAFTPDGEFILGESEVPGFWVAAGFCAHGLAGAGGIGKVMAEWIVDGDPEYDLWHMDIRRFGRHYRSQRYALARTTEVYSQYYDIHYPGQERLAGRPLRVSSAYPRLVELRAALGEKSGWERANWFESNAAQGDESLRPEGWAGLHWSPAIEAECLATRDAAGLFDESSFAKIDVHGTGAAAFLDRLCANAVDRPVGSVVYTQLLNRRGGIECDLTATRLADDRFQLVTGTAFGAHDLGWLRRHLPADGSVYVDDVTASRACFGVWGPRSREILQSLTKSDLSHEAFPYLRARELAIGDVPCLVLRVTYVGELGYELYCPTEYGLALWDALSAAGEPRGLVPAGYRAIESMRLEKGYRAWGSDITPETTPEGAGLGFAVRLDKPTPFLGRDALLAEADAGGPAERLRCIVLDDPRAVCLGGEPVRLGGRTAGRVTSGGYGYRVSCSIAFAYLPAAASKAGDAVELDLFGRLVPGTIVDDPLYDPGNTRIRSA